jgi:cob(I)alamin adenosyltransferase
MKIYTRTGDEGQTGLPSGQRLPKDAQVMEVVGTVDETNTALGMVRATGVDEDMDRLLDGIQHQLLNLGSEVARLGVLKEDAPVIGPQHVQALEEAINRFDAELAPLRNFILPGGTIAAAQFHFARAVCRRAERRLVALQRGLEPPLSPQLVPYLNRLSDLLFVLARAANARAGRPDVIWRKPVA